MVTGHFALGTGGLRVFVTSFAYRHGISRDADLIFDVRFLDNPHYFLELRQLTGRERKTYLTIAIGCTGGRHRSVFVAERLAAQLGAAGLRGDLAHRSLAQSGSPALAAPRAPPTAS